MNTQLPAGQRFQAALKAGGFYAGWYPKQWLPFGSGGAGDLHPKLARHVRYAQKTSRRLARQLFHAIVRFGPKLEREQVLLSRFVEIGAELFAIAASCARAQSLLARKSKEEAENLLNLVDYFCESARLRVDARFRGIKDNADRKGYRLAQQVLKTSQPCLEDGILQKDF
jgi:hypothetical protein